MELIEIRRRLLLDEDGFAPLQALRQSMGQVGREVVRDWLLEVFEREAGRDSQHIEQEPLRACIDRVQSYRDAGVWTDLHGLIIRTADGEEFQLTVVQSAYARRRSSA